ncbi:MAG TPA: hypothetical protein VJL59_12785, partial [Anaerolineales bacterium]|nr:hypothetical protein [Anaerolineales bacterium]
MYNRPVMEDVEFVEPDDAAFAPQPPELVKIESLQARVYPDGRRVRLDIVVTPFVERPNLEFTITNTEGREVASLSVIESMDYKFEMTAHLRGPQPVGRYTLRGELFYDPESPRKVAEITFDVTPTRG